MGLRKTAVTSFAQQVIIEYLLSNNDDIITEGTDSLIAGCNSKSIESLRVDMKLGRVNQNTNRRKLMDAGRSLNGAFRLYLRGHGDWQAMTLGGRSASEVVADVGVLGNLDKCQVISITGCQLALSPAMNGTGTGTNSFAKQFHSLLSSGGKMEDTKYIPVFARTKTVNVANQQLAEASARLHELDRSSPLRPVGSKGSSRDSKKVLYWQNSKQMIADAANADSVILGLAEFGDFGSEA